METLEILPEQELTKNIYGWPVPEGTIVDELIYESESHSGSSRGAVDIPCDLGTLILSPLDGEVVHVEDSHTEQGVTAEFAKYNNYVFIKHANGEYSKLTHMPQNSVIVKVCDKVKEGQQIAVCGFVGATTRPHVHWLVFKVIRDVEEPYTQGLKIQLKRPLEGLLVE